ncbi:MAG: cation transporter, partial [Spirochaetia bacterium]|nr:cation transporter [Spirochaetia bacterium]
MIWLKFSVTALIVVLFCISLSKYADELAAAKRIGKGFVGFVLLGFITSIPELISTVSSTVYLDNPVLGTANI